MLFRSPHRISHNAVHAADPQTLAYALFDSPVGCAAWLWERRRAWSDCGGDVLSVFDRDELCTLASIYWFGEGIATAMRLYHEHFKGGMGLTLSHRRTPAIEVPAGYGLFPKEIVFTPRALVAANADLRRWSVMPKGGHFAPAEVPDLVAGELRAFFRELR